MTATLVDSDAIGFADGNTGHVYTFPAGAPSVGQVDVLQVNSDTTVSTPAGFTAHEATVGNQGAYIFSRKAVGGESDNVTITTSGNFNAVLVWSRWDNVDAYSDSNFTQAASGGTSLPATSTGVLADTDMLLIAYGALHNFFASPPASPVWSNGFTPLEAVTQGTGTAGCTAYTGYKTNAGTASETIDSVTWTNTVTDRYALWVAFTTLDSPTGSAVTGALEVDLPAIEADLTGSVSVTADPVGESRVVNAIQSA